MKVLTLEEVLDLHQTTIEKQGGSPGIRDEGALLSAIDQPRMTAFGADLYPTYSAKAAALAFSIINNHPFVDGNKRTGFVAMATFLSYNGHWLEATDEEAEEVILSVADGSMSREELAHWIASHITPVPQL